MKQSRKKKKSAPAWVWVLVVLVAAVAVGIGGYFVHRAITRTSEVTQPLPQSADLPPLPQPELPRGEALPEHSGGRMQLPEGQPLPETKPGPRPELPEGEALPEARPRPEPEPEPQPSGEVLWGGSVHPFRSNMPLVQPQSGYMFVTALYRVVNRSTVSVHVDHHATAISYGGRTYRPYVWASGMDAMQNRRFLSPVDLAPQSATEGYVAFQLPRGARNVVPHLNLQGLPPSINVRRVDMDDLPPVRGAQPTIPLQ